MKSKTECQPKAGRPLAEMSYVHEKKDEI